MHATLGQRWQAARQTGPVLYCLHGLCRLTRRPVLVRARLGRHRLTLRAGTADVVAARAGLGGEYQALAGLLPADYGGTIVDAGAHIGSSALALAALWPRARIVCLEPQAENFALLVRNVADHPRIEPRHAALAAVPGRARLRDRGTGTWGASLVAGEGQGAEVACIDLRRLLGEAGANGIGLLKLDIEGAERDILRRCTGQLARIPVVLAELHDRIAPGCTKAFDLAFQGREIRACGPEKRLAVARQGQADCCGNMHSPGY